MQNTNKVTVQKSLTTGKELVKVSRVAYGYISGNTLIIDRKPTQSVMNSITIFASKNNLNINI